jgi:ectoine hydroxylase-related dioxygenase (phytanoyl-CoA dioxygenase family)
MTYPLAQEQIDFYQKNGFVQLDEVLSEEELEELKQYVEEIMASGEGLSSFISKGNESYYKMLNQRTMTWRDHAGMAKFVVNPKFADIARRLCGTSAIRLFNDQVLIKMPGDSKPTPWHQDLTYWPMNEPGALSIWIALDDVDENNGCMMFVPESRRAGKLNPIDLTNPQDLFEYTDNKDIANTRPVIVRMKAGCCTFHDSLTFHYAYANRTDLPRRAMVIIYMPDGTTYNGAPYSLTDGNFQQGDVISGNFFPILSKA